jgi:hypothetical protein
MPPPVKTLAGDVVLPIVWHQVLFIGWSPPACDLAAVGQDTRTFGRPPAVRIYCIPAPEITPQARASPRPIWTQPPIALRNVGVSVALYLLEFCVPVSALSHPAKVRYVPTEVSDCPKTIVIVVSAFGFLADVAVGRVVVFVFVDIAIAVVVDVVVAVIVDIFAAVIVGIVVAVVVLGDEDASARPRS